ncbi:hypothetical protein LWI29_026995 [Acer saccharum]|uniref:Uncharacterized protein n=1 Tax=Acer saccharum TaxID=4024 RepID=A0AA39TVF8_ACESA|nr:hypothetical protein LWI29_026995 [Acer saccharum]
MWTLGSNPWLDELKSKLLIAYNNRLVSTWPEVELEEQVEWAGDRYSYNGISGADVFTRKLAVTTRLNRNFSHHELRPANHSSATLASAFLLVNTTGIGTFNQDFVVRPNLARET